MSKPRPQRAPSGSERAPAGLSPRSRALWSELHALNDFGPHEDEQLARALGWFDLSDALRREAEGLAGRGRRPG